MTYIVIGDEPHTGRMREQQRFDTWAEAHAFSRICLRWCTTVTIEEHTA